METFDAIIVGAGPAGSTCARFLRQQSLRVLLLDRAPFPRVKLCAGWLSEPIWEVLQLSPSDYPHGLWPWERCHVIYAAQTYTIPARGYFIRRYEFDDFLLSHSGAETVLGHGVQRIERGAGDWLIDGQYRTRYIIGAGGTHCPVARTLFPAKRERPVGVQEREFSGDAPLIARHRAGRDGEPELLLHRDLRGYAWNIPKTDWINVGCGTLRAREVKQAWNSARDYFTHAGHIPDAYAAELDQVKGHSYYLFHPDNLDHAARDDGAYLIGDALGLAQPLTAEGILPAVLSGRLCGTAIAAGTPMQYPIELRRHPIMADYHTIRRLRDAPGKLAAATPAWLERVKKGKKQRSAAPGTHEGSQAGGQTGGLAGDSPRGAWAQSLQRLSHRGIAHGFAWMFSGKALPGGRLLHRLIR